MKRATVIVGILCLSVFLVPWLAFKMYVAMWSRPVVRVAAGADNGYYFRLKSGYLYKGVPFDFNIVAGCNARISQGIDRERTAEVGLVPFAFGKKAPDGKGVVIKVPDVCQLHQTSADGRVPPDFLPYAAVYDDADKPMFGWLYATDDAYNSPLAELKFLGASIATATREDFVAWRDKEAAKNIIKPDMLDWTLGSLQGVGEGAHAWKPGKWYFGMYCSMMTRKPVPEDMRARVRALWLDTPDVPQFWVPPTRSGYELANVLTDMIWVKVDLNNRERRNQDFQEIADTRSALRRRGNTGGRIQEATAVSTIQHSPEVYPWSTELSYNWLSLAEAKNAQTVVGSKIWFSLDRLGFGRCDAHVNQDALNFTWPTAEVYENRGSQIGGRSPPRRYIINDGDVTGTAGTIYKNGLNGGVFQSDSYAFRFSTIEFRDIFGGL